MNQPRPPDIEIYVRDTSVDEVVDWLGKRLGALEADPARGGRMRHFIARRDGIDMPVRVMTEAVGKAWTCVWLDSPDTPWADDLACARDCVAFLGKEVRISAGSWQEGDDADPDAFVRVTADGETGITWRTG